MVTKTRCLPTSKRWWMYHTNHEEKHVIDSDEESGWRMT